MRVEPYGIFTFLVSSETDSEETYLVDLLAYDGNGQCSCPHWANRIGPRLDEDSGQILGCKHLSAARRAYFAAEAHFQDERQKKGANARIQAAYQKPATSQRALREPAVPEVEQGESPKFLD